MFNQKFTPLEKQGHIYKMNSILNKSENHSVNSKLNSRRILCFDSALSEIQNVKDATPDRVATIGVTKSANLGKQLLNLKKMTQSPYQLKNMAFATPLTAAMEMYNWLYDKIRKREYYSNGTFHYKLIKMNLELSSFFRKIGEEKQKQLLESIVQHLTEQVVKEEFKKV